MHNDNRYYVVCTGTVDCLFDSIVFIIIVIHMQPNAVSETWNASSVSETLDGGIRWPILSLPPPPPSLYLHSSSLNNWVLPMCLYRAANSSSSGILGFDDHYLVTVLCQGAWYNLTHTHTHNSTSAKIAALEAKLRQMEEEDVGVATKKPRLSSSRPTGQTKRHVTGQKSTNNVRRVVQPSHRTNRSHYPLT